MSALGELEPGTGVVVHGVALYVVRDADGTYTIADDRASIGGLSLADAQQAVDEIDDAIVGEPQEVPT